MLIARNLVRRLIPQIGLLLLALVLLLHPDSLGASPNAQTETRTGWFTILWEDPEPGSGQPPRTTYWLTTENEERTRLLLDTPIVRAAGGLPALDRRRVTVTGQTMNLERTFRAEHIQVQSERAKPENAGSQPWISVGCKFSNLSDEPKNLSYFLDMYRSTFPGLDHYWRELSYDKINVLGSNAVAWFTLPHNRAYYTDGVTVNFDTLTKDCLNAADAGVNFTRYTGVNLMFNAELHCCATGGGFYMTRDGVSKVWDMTWMPPWGYANVAVMAHEMGHGFGLPHSTGNYGQTYDNVWDVMSDTWTNCQVNHDPTYGCVGQHTIAFYKDALGWIPNTRKFIAQPESEATITLERLALPQIANYRIARIPIDSSTTRFYTVEARQPTGYDARLPGSGVIIHEIDLSSGLGAHLVDVDKNGSTGDAGAIWSPGETFRDTQNQITVCILSETTSGYVVKIAQGAEPTCNFTIPTPTPTPTPVIRPGNVTAAQARTTKGDGSAAANFDAGEKIKYEGWYDNTNSADQAARFEWSVVGPCGSIFKRDGELNAIAGGSAWVFEQTLSENACGGNYVYTFGVLYNSTLTTATKNFSIASGTNPTKTPTATTTPAPPANDDWGDAAQIAAVPFKETKAYGGATGAGDDPPLCRYGGDAPGSKTVWYKYTSNQSGELTISTANSNYDTVLGVFTGERGALTRVGCNDDARGTPQSLVKQTVQAGQSYFIEVADYYNPTGLNLKPGHAPERMLNAPTTLVLNVTFAGNGAATPTSTPTRTPTPTATSCAVPPAKPRIVAPERDAQVTKPRVRLDWSDASCAEWYSFALRAGGKRGTIVQTKTNLGISHARSKQLSPQTYFWQVQACNPVRCTKSGWGKFKLVP